MNSSFILKGDICYSKDLHSLHTQADGYAVCVEGISAGVYETLPPAYAHLPLLDYSGMLILPGLTDLHMHAPQYAFRALGMDLELLDWLNTHAFPEEAKYKDPAYAEKAYGPLMQALVKGPNTRICLFSTLHTPATILLMDMLEASGLVSMVGKVNMDRNSPPDLCEESAAKAYADTRAWLVSTLGAYRRVKPILTPRFIPSCSDALMEGLAELRREFQLPLQSHLSENPSEIQWVQSLCPKSAGYADAYRQYGLFEGESPVIMAHCVWSQEDEIALLRNHRVFVAHCPQSNENLASGIAPIRRFLTAGVSVGLGSDVAGGCHSSIFRAMADAIQVSKLRWRLVDEASPPLTLAEAFYLGTIGGGSAFGQVGSLAPGYAFDALIMEDASLEAPFSLSIEDRLARVVYLAEDRHIVQKFVEGAALFPQP